MAILFQVISPENIYAQTINRFNDCIYGFMLLCIDLHTYIYKHTHTHLDGLHRGYMEWVEEKGNGDVIISN